MSNDRLLNGGCDTSLEAWVGRPGVRPHAGGPLGIQAERHHLDKSKLLEQCLVLYIGRVGVVDHDSQLIEQNILPGGQPCHSALKFIRPESTGG